jgi:hypothetical protein
MLLMRSLRLPRLCLLVSALLVPCSLSAQQTPLAQTPPMGWNSWDSFGTTIDEKTFRQSAEWIAQHLKPLGYEYVTIDEAWFDDSPPADGSAPTEPHHLDAYGRYVPSAQRFPSVTAEQGFAPLADYIHSLGLKFGIHVLQGIPKAALAADMPIQGSNFHAKDAADPSAGCIWNTDNFSLQDNPAGQAYYDSIARLYASWHVDLIKIDCISSRPYKGEEIRMFHDAVAKSGRPMLISLSPGPAPLDEAANLEKYAQQWRISDDVWDVWQSTRAFPQGLNDQIARAAKWLPYAGPGHWPDSDMLPIGELRPAPGWGKPRATMLTPDEQRSMINLWSMVRSPLVYGGNPMETDPATLALLTNPEVIAVDQHSRDTKSVILNDNLAVYTSHPGTDAGTYVAVFNRQDTPQEVDLSWKEIGLDGSSYRVHDLWGKGEAPAKRLHVALAPHASALLLLR